MQDLRLAQKAAASGTNEASTGTENDGPDGTKQFFAPPTYTMKDIYDAIPAHCFERNTFLSAFYVFRDFFYAVVLLGLSTQISHLPTQYLRISAWIVYSFVQGLVFTGLWELAHECGQYVNFLCPRCFAPETSSGPLPKA
jgi:omega-6 fatty acid desaturase (delta-12 desaturase)